MWLLAAVGGALSVLTGALPAAEARQVTSRVAPVLLFLVAITVLAELADSAGVFDLAAVRVARLARGSVIGLFLLVALLGTATTVLLSLDTTAVLLTPVVLSLAHRLRLSPLPFAMLAVWVANTASLLLPVSNLTNLLALDRLQLSASQYTSLMAWPAAVAVTTAVAVLVVRFTRQLKGRYEPPDPFHPDDRLLSGVAAVACVAFAPAVLLGAPAWAAAVGAAVPVAGLFLLRRRWALGWRLLPWRLVVLTEGLFLVVSALGRHGLDSLLAHLVGSGGAARVGTLAAAAANAVNNLPAYLALERTVPRPDLPALLVGVNVGPLVLIWGSLATLLWRERCRARGLHVGAGQFALLGLVGLPFVLGATLLAVAYA